MKLVSFNNPPLWRRRLAVLVIAIAALLAFGGRCIDRTNERVDSDGYTHISGEMVNDTDIQGTQIMLRARLLDAQGNVVAQKDGAPCPPDTQPHNQTMFDLRFDNPNVPAHASFDVRPISGITLTSPLPAPPVVVLQTVAERFESFPPFPDLTNKDVLFAFNIRNQSDQSFTGVQGCTAVYDHTGNIVFGSEDEITQLDANGQPEPATIGPQALGSVFMQAKGVPVGPVQVRAWLWFGQKGAATSQFQFITTPFITIQTVP
ncbi:MAG TPA: hypothetical protein VIE40_00465 [Dehalococcoidia bacterium]|jgi:hypothetical protein